MKDVDSILFKIVSPKSSKATMKSPSVTESAPDLQLLFGALPGLYLVLSPDLHVVAVSDAYLQATMKTREELIGHYLFDVFPENPAGSKLKGADNLLASFERVLKERIADVMPVQQYDVQRPKAEGGEYEERYWNLQSTPVLDDQQKVKYIIHRVQDVTETIRFKELEQANQAENIDLRRHLEQTEEQRKKFAAALEDANLRLEAALEAGDIGTWTWDIIKNQVVADKNLAKFFSVSAADAAGGAIENYLSAIHAKDRERVLNLLNETLSSQALFYEAEYRLVQSDKTMRSVVARGRILRDESGKPFQLSGVVIDLTARKKAEDERERSEKQLRLALQVTNLGLWDFNPQTLHFDSTPRFRKIFGLSAESEMTAEDLNNFLHPEDQPQVAAAIMQALNPIGDGKFKLDYRIVQPTTGAVRWVHAVGQAQFEGSGKDKRVNRFIGTFADITDRKEASEKLRESRTRLQFVLDAAQIGDWDLDLITGKAQCSFLHDKCFGATEPFSDWNYETFLAHVHPDDQASVDGKFKRALAEQKEWHFECRVVWPDKSTHWIEAHGGVYRYADEKPLRMLGIIADITERVQAGQALRESEERFRHVADAAPVLIWLADTTKKCTWFNKPWLQFTGRTMEQEYGDGWSEGVHPEDLGCCFETYVSSFDARQSFSMEYRLRRCDGEFRWLLDNGIPRFAPNGEFLGYIGSCVDITERKRAEETLRESEERFRNMADNISQLAWMADENGWISWYNQRWFDYTGTTLEEMQGWGWRKVHHPEHVERVTAHFKKLVEEGREWEDTFPLRSKNGEYRWFLSRALPIRNEQGNIVRWFGTNTDITERKNAEAAREQFLQSEQEARRNAEAANRLKDEFLATVSHELRTPLNAILGWATMLQNKNLDLQTTAKALATIERNARAQAQLIDDLLDVSRIITGNLRLERKEIEPISFISAAIEVIRPAAESKELHLQTILDHNVPLILGDASRLQQVVWNLLSNAVKFTDQGGHIQTKLERVDSHIEICISDTGEGINPEFLPFVFDRFRQADGTSTRRHGGLGLGLAIVRQLVELHGGTVSVFSRGEGLGTSFTVRLPFVEINQKSGTATEQQNNQLGNFNDSDSDEQKSNSLVTVSTNQSEQLKGIKILIVDDERDSIEWLETVLERRGAQLSTARSVKQAIEAIRQARPDILISDIGMPKEDGYELIKQVRQLPKEQGGNTPAIALTAYARTEDRIKALQAGFQMYLSKPVEITELIAVLFSLINRMPKFLQSGD